jgi:hypothetical protein
MRLHLHVATRPDSRRYQIDVQFLPYWRTPLTRDDRVVLRPEDREYQQVESLFIDTIDKAHCKEHRFASFGIKKLTRLQVSINQSINQSINKSIHELVLVG